MMSATPIGHRASSSGARSELPRQWLLLRGLARESGHWFDFPQLFARELGVHCLTPDLPGTGQLRARRAPWSAAAHARMLDAQLEERGDLLPRGPWGVLAMSFGSMVAFSWAALHPERISHVVSISASDRSSPPYRRLRPSGLVGLIGAELQQPLLERERSIYRLTTSADFSAVEAWALGAAEIARSRPVRADTVARQLLSASRFIVPLITQPCLLLSGQADRLVSSACSEAMARRLGAPHHSHPTAGHDVALEDPGWVIEQVQSWLRNAAPSESGVATT